ncbi:MAG: class II aldolase/adducin family protein [Alphaproteobacteria bacterium]|jgi:ribulose-5-phosphate 4-epimerase/fuculose-1-phosphate aldolase|nr:class II aldolase/adducin family protein [Alphaproteobacteria bacterium]MDP6875650.1 class II aldolase/adducin family protein [Alphaproteobacteria bacterium]
MNLSALQTENRQDDPAQKQARIDLAAANRLAVHHGLHEGIFNHFTLAVPNTDDRYYQIPFGLHWSEVRASSFMEVSFDGEVLLGEGEVERSGYCIHAPMHRLSKEAACVLHTHMPFASALARLKDQRILPIGQTELGIAMQTAYDDEYTGPAFDPAEGERLLAAIGDKKILMMANHGAATIGRTVAEAYDRMYYLERVAQVQLYAMWTGQPLHVLSQEVIDKSIAAFKASPTYYGRSTAEHHFDALKRMLDREQPDYSD